MASLRGVENVRNFTCKECMYKEELQVFNVNDGLKDHKR